MVIIPVQAFCHPANTQNFRFSVLSSIKGYLTATLDDSDQWINFNAFLARPTAANLSHIGMEAGYLCDCFITDDDVRENAVEFNLFVSAALSI